MRLVSPVTGKAITTALPLAESESILGVAWCAKIGEVFYFFFPRLSGLVFFYKKRYVIELFVHLRQDVFDAS